MQMVVICAVIGLTVAAAKANCDLVLLAGLLAKMAANRSDARTRLS